jgi:hypothetical protein
MKDWALSRGSGSLGSLRLRRITADWSSWAQTAKCLEAEYTRSRHSELPAAVGNVLCRARNLLESLRCFEVLINH